MAWIAAADAHPLPLFTPTLAATVGSVVLSSAPQSATLRIPLNARVPFQVTEEESSLTVRLYGAARQRGLDALRRRGLAWWSR